MTLQLPHQRFTVNESAITQSARPPILWRNSSHTDGCGSGGASPVSLRWMGLKQSVFVGFVSLLKCRVSHVDKMHLTHKHTHTFSQAFLTEALMELQPQPYDQRLETRGLIHTYTHQICPQRGQHKCLTFEAEKQRQKTHINPAQDLQRGN